MTKIKCKYCDMAINVNDLQNGYEYHCPRCDAMIYRPGESKSVVAILSFATLVIYFWAISSPLLSVHIIYDMKLSMYDSLIFLSKSNFWIAIFLFCTILIIPFIMILLTLFIIFSKQLKIKRSILIKLIAFYIFIKEWNMIEVYFIGLLITMVKLYQLADVTIMFGFWINVTYVIFLYLSLVLFNPYDILHIDKRKTKNPYSLHLSIIFLILATIFIPASNILPIMPTYKYGVEYQNTIFDGLKAFYDQGDIFIPSVIFFTSICIPLLKILGLATMIFMVKYNLFSSYKKVATKYYIIIDYIGKYSLLDVYVVVLASAFIQYNRLVRIEIGEAIVPFTFVVIFTMMASKTFDTRLLWKIDE